MIETIKFLKDKDELKVAKVLLDTFAKYASTIEEYDILAHQYDEIKCFKQSIEYCEKIIGLVKDKVNINKVYSNIIKVYNKINEPNKSLRYSNALLKLNPKNVDLLLEQTFSYAILNKKELSHKILFELLERDDLTEKQRIITHYNLAPYYLKHENFKKGLEHSLLDGRRIGLWKKAPLPLKFWDGGIFFNKTILIESEGGIGDEFINVRFCKHLEEYGMNPVWFTNRKDLKRIFKDNGIRCIENLNEIPKDSMYTYSMLLPLYLNLSESELWYGKYLKPSDEFIKKWDWMNNSNLKIGIRWSGNPMYEHELHRQIPLDKLYNCIKDKDYEIYSLQKDSDCEELINYPDIIDLSNKLESFEDTLAVINNLDIIITSCTSIAHAAGAMDKKTIIFTPILEYYLWASTKGTETIWYSDNVKLLRQQQPKNWDYCFDELGKYL